MSALLRHRSPMDKTDQVSPRPYRSPTGKTDKVSRPVPSVHKGKVRGGPAERIACVLEGHKVVCASTMGLLDRPLHAHMSVGAQPNEPFVNGGQSTF